MKKPTNWKRGFTLIEVLVVLVILMGLMGIVTVNVVRHQSEARVKTARIQIRQLQQAVNLYRAEQGRIPTQEQGLEALVRPPAIPPVPTRYPQEGYLEGRRVPKDPWGNDFLYLVPGRDGSVFEIVSTGSDGELEGTGDAADLSTADF
ncbi:MAG: type II secretion system major pseudopilin GspG [Kiritimatiellia bacterium]|nr:type II secretion system major pseudopilin GspG [Kiritimatiellia bacterium]